jgi:RimJ/RimL family protein N-acetyltransferase
MATAQLETPVLTTPRLRVRPITIEDVDALHELWTIPAVRRYLWDDQVLARETVQEIVTHSCESFVERGFGYFALEFRDRDGLVGFCGHRVSEEGGHEIELLYGIHPRHWGEGLVAEAARAVLRHGFESCGMERVIAATDTPNQQAVRVLQKLGMVFEQRRQFHGLDTVFYSMSRTDFEAGSDD